jgi:uncharacterized DUF497 family protein
MPLRFEWDRDKSEANLKKHGVAFSEAETVFGDRLGVTVEDTVHSVSEQRFWTIGMSDRGRLLVVSHTDDDDTIGIISARVPTPRERREYEAGT